VIDGTVHKCAIPFAPEGRAYPFVYRAVVLVKRKKVSPEQPVRAVRDLKSAVRAAKARVIPEGDAFEAFLLAGNGVKTEALAAVKRLCHGKVSDILYYHKKNTSVCGIPDRGT